MYKLTVLYEHPHNPEDFEKYYTEKHLPLTQQMRGVSEIELTKFDAAPGGGKPSYYRMTEVYFISREAMAETMGSPKGQEVIDDLLNFATGGVKVLLGTDNK
jgi:uncharacterized protein (TIGR02118 family)